MASPVTARPAERPAAAPDLDALLPGRFVSVTSFKRDGTGVATPVWAGAEDGRLYALTDAGSAKVRRIRRNPRVLVAPCRPDGRLRAAAVEGRAEIRTDSADLDHAQHVLLRRRPVSYRVVMLGYRVGRLLRRRSAVADGAALVITVDGDR